MREQEEAAGLPTSAVEVYLAARPTGALDADVHFGVRRVALPAASALRGDEVLVRVLWASADPAMRGWVSPSRRSYAPPVSVGCAMRAFCVGEALTSGGGILRGALVTGALGWRSVAVVRARALAAAPALPRDVRPSALLGALGGTGLTAYFGLLRVARAGAGDVVLVSAAAGATGGAAVQIAKHVLRCARVVGVAGGPAKCAHVRDALGADACVDYRAPGFARALRAAVGPAGVDVYFDNVGGPVLEGAIAVLRDRARVVLCGAISMYNTPGAPGPRNYPALIARRASMQGFIVTDYKDEFPQATRQLARWVADGKIAVREDVVDGLENAPRALLRLFAGKNVGKVVIRVLHGEDGGDADGGDADGARGEQRHSRL